MTDRIAVVGASLMGVRTVKGLRRRGYDGEVVLIGAEDRLPYDRPPLSKQLLAGRFEPDQIGLDKGELYEDVELRLGVRATRLLPRERAVELEDGSLVRADHVVVATGATPRRLPGTDELDGVRVLRTMDDSLALREAFADDPRLVVVGAGFIGCEVAATARSQGLDVTVVEPLPAPVVRGVGPEIGQVIADLHRDHGVELRLGVGVDGFEGDGRVRRVRLSDGSALDADLVVVGVGVFPETRWLEDSGLVLDDGVVTDDRCRAEGGGGHVWAGGDVARWPSARFGGLLRIEHWTNATEMANVVAANLLGAEGAGPHDPVPYVWSDQFDAKIQALGRVTGDDDVEVVNGSTGERRFVAAFSRDGRLRGVVGMSWPRALMGYRPLIEASAPIDAVRAHAADIEAG